MKEIKFNEKYNIIQLKRNNIYEYFIEKIGYGDLRYIVGLDKDTNLEKDYILGHIYFAEEDKFWGEEF